jgi:4-hydroxy-tetrahydrodipicolinate reductase
MRAIRVVHVGLGPIGAEIARLVAARPGLESVGAIDVDPAKIGRDLGEVAGLATCTGVAVSGDAAGTLARARAHVAILCTSSSIGGAMPQIQAILRARTAIVSTTEELSYPGYSHVAEARRVHAWARKAGVAVLATGVNPGFAMDALPIALTAVCSRVDRVRVYRVQDARIRRLPFQQKIGAGLSPAEFRQRVDDGSVRHVGLTESIAMIADALGWTLDRVAERVEPKIAAAPVASELLAAAGGAVCCIVQEGVGYRDGEPAIQLHLEAYLGAPESYDAVEIEGAPPVSMRISGGIHGDLATTAIVVNSIPKVLAAPPGLHTMRDLPLPSFFPGRR